jgi:hypothetical protein
VEDDRNVDTIEIKVEGHIGAYKVWLNTEKGCRYRAYNVGTVQFVGRLGEFITQDESPIWLTEGELSTIIECMRIVEDRCDGVEQFQPLVDSARTLYMKLKSAL